jgi:hypothetical protein
MKQLELFYQEVQIHFLVNGTERPIMINATEMAKIYNKNVADFLKKNTRKGSFSPLKVGRTSHY